jgi:tetratricopeptide (TPR) repeat protein
MENIDDSTNKNENTPETNSDPINELEIEQEPTKINIEEKISEFQDSLNEILSLKAEGNTLVKSSLYDDAIEKYLKAKELIEKNDSLFVEFLNPIIVTNENLKNLFNSFKKEKVAIFSNIAFIYAKQENYNLSIEHDLKVILFLIDI